ncbi:MAG: Mpo1-like protein [Natronospirillum sp.]
MQRSIDDWLAEYSVSHQHKTNKFIHWFAVPGIYWSILALLWVLPTPGLFAHSVWLNWSTLTLVIVVGFYLRLSVPLTLGMTVLTFICYGITVTIEAGLGQAGLLTTAVSVFVVLWIGQFIGHHVEGKRPSFFQDIQFLMIGPAWIMAFLFKKLGWRY